MLLFAVSVLVVAQSNSEIPEGLMNNPVFVNHIQLITPADTSLPVPNIQNEISCTYSYMQFSNRQFFSLFLHRNMYLKFIWTGIAQ